MNGAMIPTTASNGNAVSNNVAGVNSQRIATVSERLGMYAQTYIPEAAPIFINLCISLSRGIDYAIANNEIPAKVSNLPTVCKLVCKRGGDCNLQAAIMVLMVTMKHACEAQWFSLKDTQEVLLLAEEVAKIFNTCDVVSSEQRNITTVSEIMSRYYPRIKLGHIVACIDIKPGFEARAVDFHITKQMSRRTEKKIQMLVTTRDNIETSACIVTPQKVNFLLNGRGVAGRIVGHMEVGPQLPTVVTSMLRYGTNLLQAIGHFDAHYIVLIAFMGDIASSFLPIPEDYAQPTSVSEESDVELEEGPWRISLNCPITFTRIKRPAKGKGCKHLQCFDLSNFLEMNSRCPSWKCPSCIQSVCYPDLRIDKNMFKILQEVAENVSTVIIKTDGSWEAISGNEDHKDEPIAKASETHKEKSDQPTSSALPNEPFDICDLTEGDDDMVIIDVDMPEDTKPIAISDFFNTCPPQVSTRTNLQPAGISTAPRLGHFTPSPVLTDSVTSAARQIQEAIMGTNQQPIRQTSLPSPTNHMQVQHTPRQQSPGSVYGGNPLSRDFSRPGITLPGSSPMMSTGPDMNNVTPSHRGSFQQQQHAYDSQLDILSAAQRRAHMPFSPITGNPLRPTSGPQAARPTTPTQVSNSPIRGPTTTPQVPIQPRSSPPNPGLSNTFRPTSSPLAANQPRSTPSPGLSNSFRSTLSPQSANQPRPIAPPVQVSTNPIQVPDQPLSTTPLQISNHTPQPTRESLLPHTLSAPPHLRARSSQTQPGARAPINPQYRLMTPPVSTTQQPSPASRPRNQPPFQMQNSRPSPSSAPPGRPLQVVSRTQDLVGAHSEQNWQPDGRMRGSLTGRNFEESLSQFVIRPTQQTAPNPPAQLPNKVNNMQALIGNRNFHASSQANPSQNNNS